MNLPPPVSIQADHRETRSNIPQLLEAKGAEVFLSELDHGDYIINYEILVERKSKEDFVQSLMGNRLFPQCKRLKENASHCLMIVEGNPYQTTHKTDPATIKGAILSILVAWQVPVIFSKNNNDTAELLLQAGRQNLKDNRFIKLRQGIPPKKIRGQQLYFLEGLPKVGARLALRMLEHFGSISAIMNASAKELTAVEGIGKQKAKQIVNFLNQQIREANQ